MKRHLFAIAVFLGFALRAWGQEAGHAIWGRQIAPQPFEKKPFHQIVIPDWVQNTVGCGYTLSVMDSSARTEAVKHGVTVSEMGFVDPFFAYYDSKLLHRRSPHVPAERLTREIAEYKKLGVRILGVYPPCLQGEVYEAHPDWRRIDSNTTTIPQVDMQTFPHGGMLCLLGPYGDFLIEVLTEIVTMFPDVDAFSFDGLHYGGFCYCEQCRTNYRKDTQSEIPNPDLNDPAFRRYQHWADRRMEDLMQRMQSRLKSLKPSLALITWTTNAGRWGHFLSIPRNMPARMNLLLDAPDQEFWLDETNRGTTIVPAFANAYIWATTNHRVAFSEPYILSHGNPYGKDSFPPHEIERRMMLALTYGACPSIAVIQPKHLQQELYTIMDEVQKRKPWLVHKQPEPWAAMLMSDNTRNFYGRASSRVEERYMANVLGTFRAAQEEHLPITVINDWNLNPNDLARYRVLILPNAACLDAVQTASIEEFVKNGGGLVASLDTSLFNEFGDPRDNFSLAKVFGVDYRGLPEVVTKSAGDELDINFAKSIGPDYWEKRKSVFDFRQDVTSFLNQGKMQTYVGSAPVTFKGPAVKTVLHDPDAAVIGTLTDKSGGNAPVLPCVVSRKHGEGRVVYFAGGLDAAYYLYSYPYQRLALVHAIRWAASEPEPVNVKAPMCVHSTIMRQQFHGEHRLIIHLHSDLNSTADHAFANDDVPLREEVIPIHDIQVMFGPQYSLHRVHLQPGGKVLEMQKQNNGTMVTVPRLDVHTIVVAELDPAP